MVNLVLFSLHVTHEKLQKYYENKCTRPIERFYFRCSYLFRDTYTGTKLYLMLWKHLKLVNDVILSLFICFNLQIVSWDVYLRL